MHSREMRGFRQILLRGGVLPAFADRAVEELRDHYDDLEREALRAGCSAVEASTHASARLGRGRVIAAEILKRQELRSWPYRWSWVAVLLRQLVLSAWLVATPALVVVARGPALARWGVSTGAAACLTVGLLLLMTQLFSTRIAVF